MIAAACVICMFSTLLFKFIDLMGVKSVVEKVEGRVGGGGNSLSSSYYRKSRIYKEHFYTNLYCFYKK